MAFLSVRDLLKSQLDDFLKSLNLRDFKIHDGILRVVDRLKTYREEGRPLTPEIYIYLKKDATNVQKSIPYSRVMILGKGPIEINIFDLALKKCATLARDGWHIFLEIGKDEIVYGLFRTLNPFYSVPIENILLDTNSIDQPIIMIKQLAENVVLIKGPANTFLEVHFTTKPPISTSLKDHQKKLVQSIVKKVDPELKDSCESFFNRAILDASLHGHGFLVAVINKGKKIPIELNDGTILKKPISVLDMLRSVKKENSIVSYSELQACLTTISGMLSSDGITLFDTAGRIIGYNIFIKLNLVRKKKTIVGGARKRSYEALQKHVKDKTLTTAYYQSQDGDCDCFEVISNVK